MFRFKNKRYFILLPLFFLFSCTSTKQKTIANDDNAVTLENTFPPFEGNTVDGVLVTISDRVILFSDLQQSIASLSKGQTRLLASGKLIGGTVSPEQANQILQSLINEKVLQIKASDLGLDLTDDELTQRINQFIKQQGYKISDLEAQLLQSHKSMDDYRKEFKNEILRQQVIGKVISPLVTVTNEEVKAFYLQQTKNTKQISAVKLRSLMLSPESSSDLLHAKETLLVQKKIAQKENFVSLVKQYSVAVNAKETEGVLSPKPVSELPPELSQKLGSMNIGDVAGPFVLGNSVFFFQYLGAEFSSTAHMNMDEWKNRLLELKFNERLGEYLSNERSKLKIVIRPFHMEKQG